MTSHPRAGKGEDLAIQAAERGPKRFQATIKAEVTIPLLFC
jgi:hypothetical protein